MTVLEDVIVHEEDGDAFLLHVGSGRYYGLNRSGVIVWDAISKGGDPVEALSRQWPERPPEVLRADADALVDSLLKAGLIGGGEPGASAS